MSCPYCRGVGEHDYRCPLWTPNKKATIKCGICDEYIDEGEEYVEIDGWDYHKDCLTVDNLLDAIGVIAEEMSYELDCD